MTTPSFNTTLVQLKVNAARFMRIRYVKFQYHTGPIKRRTVADGEPVRITCFNTTLVQLKGKKVGIDIYKHAGFNTTLVQLKVLSICLVDEVPLVVSIPHWSN